VLANYFVDNGVWINQGRSQGGTSGYFLDSGQSLGNGISQSVDLADLDGDSDLDVFFVKDAVQFSDQDSYQIWLNQGGIQGGVPGLIRTERATSHLALGPKEQP
jgi:hypothetical protein